MPPTPYRCILMDPPWNETGGGRIKRGADRHYPLMKARDMPAAILGSGVWRPAKDAHLYMWVTNNYLPKGLWLMEALGFTYKTNIVWLKSGRAGLGQYFRGRHELLLFGIRGRGKAAEVCTPRRDLTSAVVAERGRHSEKPADSYALIEARSAGPRIEFFARRARPGWDAWGNEAPRADASAPQEPTQGGDAHRSLGDMRDR